MNELPVTKPESGSWVQWEQRALLYLHGPDSKRYLNGQVSNQVDRDLSSRTIAACLCSLKGKVDFLVWITQWEDGILIDGELEERERLKERLDRYLIADDCELIDKTGELELVHRFGELEEGRVSYRLGAPAVDLWMNPGTEPSLDDAHRMTDETVELLKLSSLLPESGKEISGNEFPSELGLDKWAVDFHKGCYLGQEIISRIESVGKTKRRLVAFHSDERPETNGKVIFEDGKSGEVKRHFSKKIAEKYWGTALASERAESSLDPDSKPLRGVEIVNSGYFERPI